MIPFVIVAFSLIGFLMYGCYRAIGIRLDVYVSNRDRSGFWEVLFSILATCLGGWMFFGVCAIGYEAGTIGYAIGVAYAMGLVVMGIMAPAIKRIAHAHKCDIVDDVVALRYGESGRYLISAVNFMVFLAFIGSQFLAFRSLLAVSGGTAATILVVAATVVVIAYTALAGYRGVMGTDVAQFIVFMIGTVALFLFILAKVEFSALTNLPTAHYTGYGDPELGYGKLFLIGIFLFFGPSLLVRSDLWQRIASSKDARIARRALITSAPIMLIGYFIFTTIGIYARAVLGPQLSDSAESGILLFSRTVGDSTTRSSVGAVVVALATVAVFAAILSTADSFLNLLAETVSKARDRSLWSSYESGMEAPERVEPSAFYRVLSLLPGVPASPPARTASERALLFRLRVWTVLLGVLSVCVAVVIPSIVDLIVASASAMMIFAPAVIAGVFSRQPNRRAGFISMAAGLVTYTGLVLKGYLSEGVFDKSALFPAVLVAILMYFLGTKVLFSSRGGTAGAKMAE